MKIAGLKLAVGLAILTWFVVFIFSRVVSLASILTAVAIPVYMLLFKQSVTLICLSTILCISIILRHKANLKRLLRKEEKALR
jgi:glycerol-3-phosphate acyltransferase PlsY